MNLNQSLNKLTKSFIQESKQATGTNETLLVNPRMTRALIQIKRAMLINNCFNANKMISRKLTRIGRVNKNILPNSRNAFPVRKLQHSNSYWAIFLVVDENRRRELQKEVAVIPIHPFFHNHLYSDNPKLKPSTYDPTNKISLPETKPSKNPTDLMQKILSAGGAAASSSNIGQTSRLNGTQGVRQNVNSAFFVKEPRLELEKKFSPELICSNNSIESPGPGLGNSTRGLKYKIPTPPKRISPINNPSGQPGSSTGILPNLKNNPILSHVCKRKASTNSKSTPETQNPSDPSCVTKIEPSIDSLEPIFTSLDPSPIAEPSSVNSTQTGPHSQVKLEKLDFDPKIQFEAFPSLSNEDEEVDCSGVDCIEPCSSISIESMASMGSVDNTNIIINDSIPIGLTMADDPTNSIDVTIDDVTDNTCNSVLNSLQNEPINHDLNHAYEEMVKAQAEMRAKIPNQDSETVPVSHDNNITNNECSKNNGKSYDDKSSPYEHQKFYGGDGRK